MKKHDFERTSIFRPGALDRGGTSRSIEKLLSHIAPTVKVSAVAKAMVLDAERNIGHAKPATGLAVFEMKAIQASGETMNSQPPEFSREL